MAKRKKKKPMETFGHTIYVLPIPFAEVEALHAEDERFQEWFTPVEGIGAYSALLSNDGDGDFDDPDVAWATAFSLRCHGPVFLGYFHDDFPHIAMFERGQERYDGFMRDPEDIVREAGLGVIFGE